MLKSKLIKIGFLIAILTLAGFAYAQTTPGLTPEQEKFLELQKEMNDEAQQREQSRITGKQGGDDSQSRCMSQYRSSIGTPPAPGGNETPVYDGSLIGYTGQIGTVLDLNTGQTSAYAQMICRHVYSLRRMEQDMEKKTFISDPDAIRHAGEDIETQKVEFVNFVKSGRDSDGDGTGDSSFFPANVNDYLEERRQETTKVLVDDLNKSDNLFKASLSNFVETEASRSFNESLRSTISATEYNQLATQPLSGGSSNFWRLWNEYVKPQNNPMGSLTISAQQARARLAQAEEQSQMELLQNNGFLNNKKCVEWTGAETDENRTCRRWETLQPGSILNDTYSRLLNSRLDRTLNVDGANDYIPTLAPNIQEIIDPANVARFGNPQDNNANGVFTDPEDDFDGDGRNNSGDDDDDNDGISDDKDADPFDPTVRYEEDRPPVITLNIVTAADKKSANLSWSATGATQCVAGNTWIEGGQGLFKDIIQAIAYRDTDVGTSGQTTISLPLAFEPKLAKQRGSGYSPTTVVDITQTSEITVTGSVDEDDEFVFSLKPHTGRNAVTTNPFKAASASPEGVVDTLRALLTPGLETGTHESRYKWTFSGATVKIETEGKYVIKCSNNGGESTKTVSLKQETE